MLVALLTYQEQANSDQDPAAALALVSARPKFEDGKQNDSQANATNDDQDPDLKRAKDLLELHATVKVAHQDGTDAELNRAREDVERVMRTLR